MISQNRKPNCIIDARVSTDKQLAGNGLDDQRSVCESVAKSKGWNVVEVFSKSYSGRAKEREDFKEILEYIRKSQRKGTKIDYYLFKSIDRLTRAGHFTYTEMKNEIQSLGVELVDAYNVIQKPQNTLEHLGVSYSWSKYEPSEMMEMFEASRGKNEVRDILTRMVSAEIGLVRQGFSMRSPNDGYINKKVFINGKQQSVLAQDEKRAYFYKQMFLLRGSGQYSDKEIVSKINALGYRSKQQNVWNKSGKSKIVVGQTTPKKLTVKHLQNLIQKTMYAGIKNEKWNTEPTVAVFAEGESPIVTFEEFNKANRGKVYLRKNTNGQIEILTNFSERATAKRLKYHPDYKYDKLINCHICKKPFKNSGKGNKGKAGKYYQAHHCDRTEECRKFVGRISKEVFEEHVTHLLNNLKFKEDYLSRLRVKLLNKYRDREKEILDKSIKIGGNVNELKARQSKLMSSIDNLTSSVVIKMKEEEIEDLERQIIEATEQRDKIEIKERDIKSFVNYARDLMEHPIKILGNNKDPYQQKAFFSLVFDGMPTYEEIVNGTPKLTLIFKLSEEFKTNKSLMVTLRGIVSTLSVTDNSLVVTREFPRP